jgi:2-desacetyl-2-hydroxyethyl bacteriochlorophyllide A dehydrogenase
MTELKTELMQGLVVTAPNQLEVRAIPRPVPGPYEALVQIEVCGICNSTDHKLVEGTMSWVPPTPFVIGHEAVGRVVEVGEKVRKFKVGDRVTRPVYPAPADGSLHSGAGGFAQYGIVRDGAALAADGDNSLVGDYTADRQLVMPPGLSARDAALSISLSETASVLRHLPNPRGQKILVAGTGVAGLAFVLWFKMAGGFVISLGRREERLQKARDFGADATVNTSEGNILGQIEAVAGGPVDGIIEATGDAPLAEQLLDALSAGGYACAYGVPPTGTDYHARWQTAIVEEHLSSAWVTDLLARGWIQPEWFISHEWPFAEVVDAFAQAERGEVVKGFVHF